MANRPHQGRAEVAAEAARILATEGQLNYHAAKKKAAERCGVSSRSALPGNTEVEEALKQYQMLYGGEAHRENLEHLRHTAVRAMQILEKFQPRLVGPVLEGTAGTYSRVALHLFAETHEQIVLHFFEHGVPFQQEQRQIRWHKGQQHMLQLIIFDLMDREVEAAIFELHGIRQAPPSPVDGKPQRRATLPEVQLLLNEQHASDSMKL